MDKDELKKKVLNRDTAKTVTSTVSGVGVHSIIDGIVATNVPSGNIPKRICVYVGKIVIASMINTAAQKHTDKAIDEVADYYNKLTEEETNG